MAASFNSAGRGRSTPVNTVRRRSSTGSGGRAGEISEQPSKLVQPEPTTMILSVDLTKIYAKLEDLQNQIIDNDINIAELYLIIDNLQDQVQENFDITINLIKQRMRWLGNWTQQLYKKFDTVRDGAWTMIANKDTEERPAPQESGVPVNTYPEVPIWDTPNPSHVGVVHSGHRYTFSSGGIFKQLRVWIPAVTPTATYHVIVANITDPNNIGYSEFTPANINENDWTIIGLSGGLIQDGDVFIVYIDSYDSADNVQQFSDGWTFTGNDNNAIPNAGEWNTRTNNILVRINGQSLGGNYDTQIANSTAGSTWRMQHTGDPNSWVEYRQDTAVTSVGSDHTFNYTVSGTGANGQPTTGDDCLVTLTAHTAAATEIVALINQWVTQPLPNVLIEGYLTIDGGANIGNPNDGFGVDIQVQAATVSDDWDLIAYNQGFGEQPDQPQDVVTYLGETVTYNGNTVVYNA